MRERENEKITGERKNVYEKLVLARGCAQCTVYQGLHVGVSEVMLRNPDVSVMSVIFKFGHCFSMWLLLWRHYQ